MDFVNKMTGGGNSQNQGSSEQVQGSSGSQQQSSGGFLGGIGDKLNSAAGGGRESEKNEDYLDKGELTLSYATAVPALTYFRRRLRAGEVHGTGTPGQRGMSSRLSIKGSVLMQRQSAVEQAKDEQISDFIRGQYKSATGSDIPIKDKETRLG